MHLNTLAQRLHFPWAQTPRYTAIGWISLAVMLVCASTYNVFAKLLTDVLSPLSLVFVSELLTAFFVLFSFGTVPTFQRVLKMPRSTWLPILCISLCSGILGPLLWFSGLHGSSVVNAALFSNAEMLFLTLLGVIVVRETFTRIHSLSLVTIVAGLGVIVLKGFTETVTFQIGDVLLLLSCLSYSVGSILFRKYLHKSDPQVVILCRSLSAVAGFFLLSPFLSHNLAAEISAFPIQSIPVLLGFAFISRFLNVFSFYEAVEHLPLTTVSLSLNITVVGSIAFSTWMLHETLEPYHLLGGALVIGGALLLEFAGIHPTERHLEEHLHQGNPRRI
jgi:drug/metabolite transporter (DMT)-like permease